MGPLGCASRLVMESLRGMNGVVASSGCGVARFIVLGAGRNQEWLLSLLRRAQRAFWLL